MFLADYTVLITADYLHALNCVKKLRMVTTVQITLSSHKHRKRK